MTHLQLLHHLGIFLEITKLIFITYFVCVITYFRVPAAQVLTLRIHAKSVCTTIFASLLVSKSHFTFFRGISRKDV